MNTLNNVFNIEGVIKVNDLRHLQQVLRDIKISIISVMTVWLQLLLLCSFVYLHIERDMKF